ncbi:MAG: hypothetical protein EOM59_16485 [Clostridia bacterium]|nr:hypothetical protein [Clostridia bacterium]
MTNQERFDRVFTGNDFSLDGDYINYKGKPFPSCNFSSHYGHNEMGLFLDCMFRLGLKNPSEMLVYALANVFMMSTSYLCYGGLDDDAEDVMKNNRYFQMTYMKEATFEQRVFVYKYLQEATSEIRAGVHTDNDGGTYNSIYFREPKND